MEPSNFNSQLTPDQIFNPGAISASISKENLKEVFESIQQSISTLSSKYNDQEFSCLQKNMENFSIYLKSSLFNTSIKNTDLRLPSQTQRNLNPMNSFSDNPNTKMKMSKRKTQNESRLHPKLSYYKMKIIRSFRKTILNVIKGKKLQNFRFEEEFKRRIDENSQLFYQLLEDKKNINLAFIKKYFMETEIFENFKIFIEYIFDIKEIYQCEDLCKLFKFNCCSVTVHSVECREKWRILKEWTLFDMLMNDEKLLNE
jgi:hypothetical protein